MGQPAGVEGDQVTGQCLPGAHLTPNPATGAPQPSPAPFPFQAILDGGLVDTVRIGGKKAAVEGSTGPISTPHPGLHQSDPYQTDPSLQKATVRAGSTSVSFGGKPAAFSGCQTTICREQPAQLTGSGPGVNVGP